MRELLSPGYGGPSGEPQRMNREPQVEEITSEREAGSIPDAAGEGDPRVRRPYTEQEMMEMESMRSARYPGDDPEYHHGTSGGMWERLNKLGSVEPVMGNPSLDPAAGDMIAVSYMAGYGSDAQIGHDSIADIDKLVVGDVDATRELDAPSATPGTPMQLGMDESMFSDSRERGTHDLRIDSVESGEAENWMAEFSIYGHEPESNGERADDFDYTRDL